MLEQRDATNLEIALAGYTGPPTTAPNNNPYGIGTNNTAAGIPGTLNQIQNQGYNYGGYNSLTGQPVRGGGGSGTYNNPYNTEYFQQTYNSQNPYNFGFAQDEQEFLY